MNIRQLIEELEKIEKEISAKGDFSEIDYVLRYGDNLLEIDKIRHWDSNVAEILLEDR